MVENDLNFNKDKIFGDNSISKRMCTEIYNDNLNSKIRMSNKEKER